MLVTSVFTPARFAASTISRPAGLLSHEYVHEAGGLSGPPVKPLALHALSTIHARNRGKIPLIGIGGIDSGETALAKIEAGASLLQLYTGLIYEGPGLIDRINAYLDRAAITRRVASIQELRGRAAVSWSRRCLSS